MILGRINEVGGLNIFGRINEVVGGASYGGLV